MPSGIYERKEFMLNGPKVKRNNLLLRARELGMSRAQVARAFEISLSVVKQVEQRWGNKTISKEFEE